MSTVIPITPTDRARLDAETRTIIAGVDRMLKARELADAYIAWIDGGGEIAPGLRLSEAEADYRSVIG